MDRAGVGARRLGVQVVTLDEKHLDPFAGEVVGGRAAGEAAADYQHVAPLGHGSPTPVHMLYRVGPLTDSGEQW